MNNTLLYIDTAKQNLPCVHTDVIIAGCGAAGLYAALNLAPSLCCAILNKSGAEVSNSMYAQGGISAVTEDLPDHRAGHLADTLVAGAGLCDETAVKVLVNEAGENIHKLIDLGVPFDQNNGQLLRTLEGGHSERRILHCGGDATGLHLTSSLYAIARSQRNNIQFFNNIFLTDILTDEWGVTGVLTLDETGRPLLFAARQVIIATGGAGRVFRASTNAVCATGDGIAAAARAGAELQDMEFVQFHPTALAGPDKTGRFFLVSEAMRGEGGLLRNSQGEAFMQGAHPMAELAPRDIVARAIARELAKSGADHVYLDITHKSREFLEQRFPTIYTECLGRGIDIAKDYIPVLPVQHYLMGGVKTDLNGETAIPGLYACGEAACTGVHGANRLASNSLLECLVFGRRCALNINGRTPHRQSATDLKNNCPQPLPEETDYSALNNEMRNLMTAKCGIIRNRRGLSAAHTRLTEINQNLKETPVSTRAKAEACNIAQIALVITQAALARKHSVGAHYLTDDIKGGNNNA